MPSRTWIMGLCALSLTIWNGAAQASEGSEPADPPRLVAIEPLRVPIVDHGAMVGRLELRVMWRAGDEDTGAAAEQQLPALRAALVAAAADHARLAATPGQAVDPQALSKQLGAEAARRGFIGELLVLEAVTRGG